MIAIHFYQKQDDVYLEAQVQNITASSMAMVGVTLDPSQFYEVIDLNTKQQAQIKSDNYETELEEELTFGSAYLNPMDTRQYLYKLLPKKDVMKDLQTKVR